MLQEIAEWEEEQDLEDNPPDAQPALDWGFMEDTTQQQQAAPGSWCIIWISTVHAPTYYNFLPL